MSWWLLVPLLLLPVAAVRVVQRGFQLRRLVADGVDATGTVVGKVTFNSSGPRSRYLRYRYQAADGRTCTHRSLVSRELMNAHQEGGPIEIVYSASRPHVSAPRYLVEQGRSALREKAGARWPGRATARNVRTRFGVSAGESDDRRER